MKVRIRLSFKVLMLVLGTVFLVIFFASRSISGQFRLSILKTMSNSDEALLNIIATNIDNTFSNAYKQLLTIKSVVESSLDSDFAENEEFYKKQIKDMCISNNMLYSSWLSFDSKSVSSNCEDGRYLIKTEKKEYSTETNSLFIEYNDDMPDDVFYLVKESGERLLGDPEFYSYDGSTKRYMKASVAVPIEKNDEIIGVIGADISLNTLREMLDTIGDNSAQRLIIISNNNLVITYPQKDLVGQLYSDIDSVLSKQIISLKENAIGKVTTQTNTFAVGSSAGKSGKNDVYLSTMIIAPGGLNNSWILEAAESKDVEVQISDSLTFMSRVIIIGMIILALVIFGISMRIVVPIKKVNQIIKKLSKGQVNEELKINVVGNDELGQMEDSSNKVVEGLLQVTKFAENIGNGNSNYKFSPLSDKDVLGNAIIEMKTSLDRAKEEENHRRDEESQLNWASSGINMFNKVLRVDNSDMKRLSEDIILTLTNYIDAQMGAFYVVPDGKDGAEMVSHIGFDKDKAIINSFVPAGEGLIGRAILEKETIFISDIASNMDKIGSGLGKALPKSALVIPLIYNKNLTGLLELYSFKVFQPYQISFVEKLAENIASTISTVKINGQTSELLEKSKQQSEVLEQQEEEIRQNMEEMQAAQEESTQKEEELTNKIESLSSMIPIVRYDTHQCIVDVNDDYLKLVKAKREKLIGKRHKSERFMNEEEQIKYDKFWEDILSGKVMETEDQIIDGKDVQWISTRFIPVSGESGNITEIIAVAANITNQKKLEEQIQMIQEGILPEGLNIDDASTDDKIKQRIVDLTHLNVVYKNDDKKIMTILKRYRDQIPEQLSDIEQSIKTRNYKVLKMDVKTLKTKINYLGIKPIYDMLDAILQLIVDDKDLTSIPQIYNEIKAKWTIANDELGDILAKES